MSTDPSVSICQLALKAGKIARGSAMIPAIQSGKAQLAVISDKAGANGKKKLYDKCKTYQVPVLEMESERFDAINPGIVSSFVITDKGFANSLAKKEKTRQELLNGNCPRKKADNNV